MIISDQFTLLYFSFFLHYATKRLQRRGGNSLIAFSVNQFGLIKMEPCEFCLVSAVSLGGSLKC